MGSDTKIQQLTDQLLEYKSALQISTSDLKDANEKLIMQEGQMERLTQKQLDTEKRIEEATQNLHQFNSQVGVLEFQLDKQVKAFADLQYQLEKEEHKFLSFRKNEHSQLQDSFEALQSLNEQNI